MNRWIFLPLLVVVGCSQSPGTTSPPVEVTGRVTLNSKPVTDATLNLQPTGAGSQATLPVKNGEVKGTVTPGKYTYYLSEGANVKAFRDVPEQFRAGSMDRQLDISGGSVTFAFE